MRKRNSRGREIDMRATLALIATLREVGEDLDAIKAVLAHFRRLNSMPDVPSAPRIRTREDLRF
jgi:hypothetical protein